VEPAVSFRVDENRNSRVLKNAGSPFTKVYNYSKLLRTTIFREITKKLHPT
jgi:hypothetical protein